jgi:hypothetical protein
MGAVIHRARTIRVGTRMSLLRSLALLVACCAGLSSAGCTTAGAVLTVAGIGTDTSVAWSVVKHLHGQLTEGDERPCVLLTGVQRALSPRCGPFVPGSLDAADIARTGFAECALTLAARDPQLWPVLPELLAKGARPEACAESPLVALARREPCPDFGAASASERAALASLARDDRRAVHHDTVRMLSCPAARAAGLDPLIAEWRARGALAPGAIAFSPLDALHPDALSTALADDLEADGHTARAALGAYPGTLRPGFDEALRTSHWAALDWWLRRVPELANRVPPRQGNQLSWRPLARVLVPSFLADPARQQQTVEFLLSRGADPLQRLPANPDQTVLGFARLLKSPMLAVLEAPLAAPAGAERLAAAARSTPRGE